MRQTKFITFGIILVAAIVFGTVFWMDFYWNQQEISNTPLPPAPILEVNDSAMMMQDATAGMSGDDSYDALDKDLDSTDVNSLDSGTTEIEAEASAL